ncbi:MAG: DRTGG domain-containing protein [Angelakisella sp.]
MTVKEFAVKHNMALQTGDGERQVTAVYCGDLLSIVMGRAPADSGWVTVMGNRNAVAVAVLADVACIILAENMPLDSECREKAEAENVAILTTPLPVYQAARLLGDSL